MAAAQSDRRRAFPLGRVLLAVGAIALVVRTIDVLLVVFLAVILAVYLEAVAEQLERRLEMPRPVGLALALVLGKRRGFGKRAFLPHSIVMTMVGTGMLWVGWYGFNAGSAVAADGVSSQAFLTTTLATAVACAAWPAAARLARPARLDGVL